MEDMRSFGMLLVIAAVAAVTARPMNGQSSQGTTPAAPLAFEVASIRPVPPPTIPIGGGPWIASRGQFRAERGHVRGVIAWAYGILPPQVKGGPDWIDREPYYFDARAANAQAGPDQIRLMLQTLLADRFQLKIHREIKEGDVYRLVLGKSGSKLQNAKGGRKNYIEWTGPGQVVFTEMTSLLGLVGILSALVDAPVVDETRLSGSYNFRLEFTHPRDPRPRQADSPPDLFTAIQEQLGVQLQPAKGPVELVVIDHMERPSPN